MDMILASRNQKKIKELNAILSASIPDIRILSLDDIGFEGDIEENGTTFEENALIKARTAMAAGDNRYPAVADDSGLSVDVLGGAPGVYSARYAGGHGNDEANNQLLLKTLENTPDEKRTAQFVSVIACVFPDGRKILVRGEAKGLILREYRGEGGFGYDPLFLYLPENEGEPYNKTFSEMTSEEKNIISHRGRAIRKLAVELSNQVNHRGNT
ncbi:MAG: RdgB/HAM1 family non-canonical purine NTP pyrophosphatase [Ruminococcaceae bacterium]|nr:RdgB/HAM1 family non-canonical purine NTP pyrophosphatase [Oscillospiraceae bacterium]